ncbi:MAG: N-6 DNA methylase [Cetobacterium sp.]|uniref:N-6 DNA methylase n=1 Tax=Cetobacterium sp. TaxID=2071632 RepID=UPI002FCB70AE
MVNLEVIKQICKEHPTLYKLNNYIHSELNGIENFFSENEFKEIIEINENEFLENLNKKLREHGDYQTPIEFTQKIANLLNLRDYENILEPTFGLGNFILTSLQINQNLNIYGVELQEKYVLYFKLKILNLVIDKIIKFPNLKIYCDNIFYHNFEIDLTKKTLIIGNPPWITNSELGNLNLKNLPEKFNLKNLKGMDALTGKSNFDVTEYIILKMLEDFKDYNLTGALLCKTIVVRNILKLLKSKIISISNIKIYTIDSKKIFDVSCDSCLFVFDITPKKTEYFAKVYSIDNPEYEIKKIGWSDNSKFVSNVDNYEFTKYIDNLCEFEWRQGIKHDCSKIMELTIDENNLINGFKEIINIEDTYVYNLLKSSDLKGGELNFSRKKVIITQSEIGAETNYIENQSPKLWNYLEKNQMYLNNRKSSIYKGKPKYSIFGIGDYSFAPYKVALSGMYKTPKFTLLLPTSEGKAIMLDDTCYFLGFSTYKEAFIVWILLNSSYTLSFLESIVFLDSKRPYTKDILMRISILNLMSLISFEMFSSIVKSQNIISSELITENDYMNFKNYLENLQNHKLKLL